MGSEWIERDGREDCSDIMAREPQFNEVFNERSDTADHHMAKV